MVAQTVEARWWHAGEAGRVGCELCPRGCQPQPGQSGFCQVRYNEGGRLLTLSYGHPTGFAVDPIEKKPLFHFLPGSRILSFGTLGCTLGCRFCQNWGYSHPDRIPLPAALVRPEEVVELARQQGLPSIAYTYNEPVVFAEYMADIAQIARGAGLRNVAVTNGYVTPGARREVFRDLDAANVDLKGFSEDFYHRQTQGSLQPVLDTLIWIRQQTSIWLEITTLLIPGENDSDEMITAECEWIRQNLGDDVPVHFTAFHPDYQMLDRSPTPPQTLARARAIAARSGLRHVYVGNVADTEGQSTLCPRCGERLIERTWHSVQRIGLTGAACGKCGARLAGVFPAEA